MNEIVLASGSPRRLDLMRMIGLNPRVVVPDVEEVWEEGEALTDFLRRVSLEKGKSVASTLSADIPVVSADTVVILDGDKIGKPESREDAVRILRRLSGCMHEVWTGVAILYSGKEFYDFSRTRVWFGPISGEEIESYLEVAQYMDKAGAYAIQGRAALFVERIDGCFFNVMGFPLRMFSKLARKAGVVIPGQSPIVSGESDASR